MIKKQIEPLLMNLLVFNADTGVAIGGLLMEKLPLGVKRKLNKLREELVSHHEQLKQDAEEVKATYEGDGVKIQKELEILFNETVEIKGERALMSEIEKIETEKMYDFVLLEFITQ